MVKIDKVSFFYGRDEDRPGESGVTDIKLDIGKGECVLLCGESGCGKTTITKLINGLIPGFYNGRLTGTVTVAGLRTDEAPLYELAKHVASVFQNPKSQFFNTDAESEIVFGLENQSVPVKVIDERLEKAVRELGIEPLLKKSLFQMSGGEKQTIAFAGAYITDAEIVVLDEPSANLDLQAMQNIRRIMEKMKAGGKTIIIAEHRVSYLRGLLDTVYRIENGQILEKYNAEEFYALDEQKRIKLGLRRLLNSPVMKIERTDTTESPAAVNLLEIDNITLSYGSEIISQQVAFQIRSGDIVGVVGRNGAGKTTLLRCLSGIQKQNKGVIRFNNKECTIKKRRRISGIVMQDVNYQLFAESVEEECLLGNTGITQSHVDEILSEMNLTDLKHVHPQSLSGGQKQRLAIAVALASDKEILILDEPTSGLDYKNMKAVSNLLQKIAKKGIICIVVTHDLEFLQMTCNRCLFLKSKGVTELNEVIESDLLENSKSG